MAFVSLTAPLQTWQFQLYWSPIAYAFYMDKEHKSRVSEMLANVIADSNLSLYNRQVDDLQLLARHRGFQYPELIRLTRRFKQPLVLSALLLTVMAVAETCLGLINYINTLRKTDSEKQKCALERLRSASFTIIWSIGISFISGICGRYTIPSESAARYIASSLIPSFWPTPPVRGLNFRELDSNHKFY
jgi:hypothetical protein